MTVSIPDPKCAQCGEASEVIASGLTDGGELITWSLCNPCSWGQIRAAAATMDRFGEGTFVDRVTAEQWRMVAPPPLRA